jgi:hypothetical protein
MEDRLSELADYRNPGHCNVPENYSKTKWLDGSEPKASIQVALEGKKSHMTLPYQELKSLGFEWNSHGAAWEDHLNELADYRKIQGHCNFYTAAKTPS